MPERLTIDQTVAIDYLDPEAERHALAASYLTSPSAARSSWPWHRRATGRERRGDLTEQIREVFTRKGVVEARQVARVSEVTYLPFMLGHYVEGFPEACDGSSASPADRFHVETHIADRRDVFISDDKRLLALCGRLRHRGFPIVAMKLGDYLARRR